MGGIVYCGSHSVGIQSAMVGNRQQQEHEEAGHIVSIESRQLNPGAQVTGSFYSA